MKKQKTHIDSLDGLSKKQPFKTPDSYFDNFEARLQTRLDEGIAESAKTGTKVIRVLKPFLWLAASFILVVLLVQFPLSKFLSNYSVETVKTNIQQLQQDEYPIGLDMLDETDFYNLFTEDTSTDSLKSDEIYNYLVCDLSDYEIYYEMNN